MANIIDDVHHVLTICGITAVASRNVFIDVEGLDTLEAFGDLNGDGDVTEMAKRMASRQQANGRVILGTTHIKRIQALVYWVKDHHRRDLVPDANDWDADTMRASMTRKESEKNFEKIDVDMIDPGKCMTDHQWDSWQIGFLNKLSATLGAAKTPISYIVRNDVDSDYEFEDEDEERLYQMPLTGENFKRDNKLVYSMLKAACVKSDAWTWIQDHDRSGNGRGAWFSLIGHYDGTGELNKRLERAKEEITRLYYKNESVFPFERYITKLKENFFVLDKDPDEKLTGKQKVDQMLRGMKSSDASIVAAKTDVYKDFRSDFDKAAGFLSGLISSIHASAQHEYAHRNQSRKRNVSSINAGRATGRGGGRFRRGDGRGGRHAGRGFGRGNNGGRGPQRMSINGVDVSDPSRQFSADEWNRLGVARSYITQQRTGRGRSGNRDASSRATDYDGGRNAAAAASTRTDNDTTAAASVLTDGTRSERGSQNGRGFGRGAYRRESRLVSSIRHMASTGKRFVKSTDIVPHQTLTGHIARNEIDNHADTICAGANWRVLEFTGEYCEVSPYSDEYESRKNVPVAKCATVYTSDDGISYLFVADQVLWFGASMPNTLINPHQLRHFGISLCDDPWDPNRSLGMTTSGPVVPFYTDGPNICFDSRVPTDWEINHLDLILLTGPHWDPTCLTMPIRADREQTEMRTIRSLRICSTSSNSSPLPDPVDCCLSQLSPVYNESSFVKCLISAVHIATPDRNDAIVTGTVPILTTAAITTERHTKVTAENLARKWNIGLETAKRTLLITTQRGIRTPVHPLHRRYRVDHLHLNRYRLNGDWYTDTLFSKVKSIKGNKCAQVYTNGSFTSVHPMTSNSQIGQTLTDFSDDVGIPDTLYTDAAIEAVGPHTDFSREVNRLKIRLRRTEPGRSNQNFAAEREIGELKKRWRNRMLKHNVPKRLWDFGLIYESSLLNRIPRGRHDRTGIEQVTGQTPDISEWLDFEFYDLVWYYDQKKMDMNDDGRCVGLESRIASEVTCAIG